MAKGVRLRNCWAPSVLTQVRRLSSGARHQQRSVRECLAAKPARRTPRLFPPPSRPAVPQGCSRRRTKPVNSPEGAAPPGAGHCPQRGRLTRLAAPDSRHPLVVPEPTATSTAPGGGCDTGARLAGENGAASASLWVRDPFSTAVVRVPAPQGPSAPRSHTRGGEPAADTTAQTLKPA
jgi:hypothetical protein